MNPAHMNCQPGRKNRQIQTVAGKSSEPQRDRQSLEDFHRSMNRPPSAVKQPKMRETTWAVTNSICGLFWQSHDCRIIAVYSIAGNGKRMAGNAISWRKHLSL